MVNKGYHNLMFYCMMQKVVMPEQTIDSIHCTVHLLKGGKLLLKEKFRMAHPNLARICSVQIEMKPLYFP